LDGKLRFAKMEKKKNKKKNNNNPKTPQTEILITRFMMAYID
jgi:hypothetical protein